MNLLNKVGGALLAAVLVIALIAGLRTGTGREAGDGVLQAAGAVLSGVGGFYGGVAGALDADGRPGKALLLGLLLFVLLVLLVPAARAGRGMTAAGVGSLLVALLLFQPSLGASLRDSVSAPSTATVIR